MSSDEFTAEGRAIADAAGRAMREWAEAMRAHALAPPDRDFALRLDALAQAAAAERDAWARAPQAGVGWRPIVGAESAEPPYELRPGTGRRGPAELWTRFDLAIARLNRAIAGPDATEVAESFGEVAATAGRLADAVAREDGVTLAHSANDQAPARARETRARGAA